MIRHPPKSPLFPNPPLSRSGRIERRRDRTAFADGLPRGGEPLAQHRMQEVGAHLERLYQRQAAAQQDRKSTRLNSSHANISYAVFCLKKKKNINNTYNYTNI